MSYLVSLPVEGYAPVLVEVRPAVDDRTVREFGRPDRALPLTETMESNLAKLQPAISSLVENLRKASPDDVTVEFGIAVRGTAGLVFAASAAEGNFTVKLSWSNTAD